MGEIDIAVLTRRLTMMQQLLHDLDDAFFSDPLRLLDDAIVRYAVERILT